MEGPFPISKLHKTDDFSCGKPSLDRFLKKYALVNEQGDRSRTFVVLENTEVIGFYSLSTGSVEKVEASDRVGKFQPEGSIPVVLLGQLAVDTRHAGKGLGAALLKDALKRIVPTSTELGFRAVLVDAIDEDAKKFWLKWGFEESIVSPLKLMLLMKDLRKLPLN
jgi:GNAT superfamily N-acetyltransferase